MREINGISNSIHVNKIIKKIRMRESNNLKKILKMNKKNRESEQTIK